MEKGPNQNQEQQWHLKSFYEILDIPPTASQEEIKFAFSRLAQEHHPDKGGDTLRFQYISQAYTTLKNPQKRREYDKSLKLNESISRETTGDSDEDFDISEEQRSSVEQKDTWRHSLRYRYQKIEDRDGIVVGRSSMQEFLLDPQTGKQLSEGYIRVVSRNGIVVGKTLTHEYLLDPKTGERLSSGYNKIEKVGQKIIGRNPFREVEIRLNTEYRF